MLHLDYLRELPRDLFNEANVLKCFGQLALFILNGCDDAHVATPATLRIDHEPTTAFRVAQDDSDGAFYLPPVSVLAGDLPLILYVSLNDRRPYPLRFQDEQCAGDYVFQPNGNWNAEFLDFVCRLATEPTQTTNEEIY
jgi:hypothetical protein